MKDLPLAGRNILIVEDELLIAMDIEASIQDAGGTVVGPAGTVDAALDSATGALDTERMNRYLSRAFRQIINDAPAVWLYSSTTTAAVNRRIEVAPLPRNGWWNSLAEWSIPADKRIDRDRIGLRPAATP